jgi:predicted nuclease with TOPRIM domain
MHLSISKEEILKDYGAIIQALTDTSKFDKESAKLQSEMEVVIELLNKCVEENAHSDLDQAEYEKRYKALAESFEDIKKGLEEINEKRLDRSAKCERIVAFIKELENRDGLVEEFDEELWNGTIEKVLVHSEDDITFVFKDDMELNWNI